jgi:hypothetical protein
MLICIFYLRGMDDGVVDLGSRARCEGGENLVITIKLEPLLAP